MAHTGVGWCSEARQVGVANKDVDMASEDRHGLFVVGCGQVRGTRRCKSCSILVLCMDERRIRVDKIEVGPSSLWSPCHAAHRVHLFDRVLTLEHLAVIV